LDKLNLLNVDSYNGLLEFQPLIRKNLFNHILNNPGHKNKHAKDIGVSVQCLSRFLEEKKIDFISLCKIRQYLLKNL